MKIRTFIIRALEIIVAGALFLILLPFFLVAAILVQIDSPGKVIFVQKRVSKGGKMFNLYKLRTMKKNANGDFPPHTQINDQRFSPLCRLIRSTCIDEVPQLLNIIKGDMSFVGPRPELPKIVSTYDENQLRIFEFKPGLFGISQLALREGVDYRKKLDIELAYYPHRNLLKDSLIVVFTPLVLASHTMGKILPFAKPKSDYSNSALIKFLIPQNGKRSQNNSSAPVRTPLG